MKYEHIQKWFLALRTRPQMYVYSKEAFVAIVDTILECHGYKAGWARLVPESELSPDIDNISMWSSFKERVTTEFAEHVVDKAIDIFAKDIIEE